MQNMNRIVALVSIHSMLLALFAPGVAPARTQEPPGWDRVLALKPRDTVIVKLLAPKKKNRAGKVEKVEASGITLTVKGEPRLLRKEEIKSISYIQRPKANLVGGLIAAGGAALAATAETLGAAQDLSQLNSGQLTRSTGKHNLGLIIAGIGVAGGGLLVLLLAGRSKLIYQA